jgi:23S rRNA (guanine745-N1)-methyltransferase
MTTPPRDTAAAPALDVLAGLAACPVCGENLGAGGGALRCPAGHAFDVARQGYANLLTGRRAGTADTAAMVAARAEFLAAGHYAALAGHLASRAAALAPGTGAVLDAGAGPGTYLSAVLDARPGAAGLALDISKYAARRAARAHPRAVAGVADVWRRLPVRTGVMAVVLNVFAPRNAEEYARVLAPGGVLLVATPAPGHLAELVAAAGMLDVDDRKDERLAGALSGGFAEVERAEVTMPLRLGHRAAAQAVLMGPSGHHLAEDRVRDAVTGLPDPVEATASVVVTAWRART